MTAWRNSGSANSRPNSPSDTIVPARLPYRKAGNRHRSTSNRKNLPAFERRCSTAKNRKIATTPNASANGMIDTFSSGQVQPRIENGAAGVHQP